MDDDKAKMTDAEIGYLESRVNDISAIFNHNLKILNNYWKENFGYFLTRLYKAEGASDYSVELDILKKKVTILLEDVVQFENYYYNSLESQHNKEELMFANKLFKNGDQFSDYIEYLLNLTSYSFDKATAVMDGDGLLHEYSERDFPVDSRENRLIYLFELRDKFNVDFFKSEEAAKIKSDFSENRKVNEDGK